MASCEARINGVERDVLIIVLEDTSPSVCIFDPKIPFLEVLILLRLDVVLREDK
jgi:hypothetical protein